MSELIRFLRFQRSPNPVSLAVIVTTSRFWPWQAVEDRRCVETLLCPALALDSRLGIGTAFLGLLECFSIAYLHCKLSEQICPSKDLLSQILVRASGEAEAEE